MNARPITELAKKQLETFMNVCKQACGSRRSFDKNFVVLRTHIFERAAETLSHLRHTLQNKENLAKVIVAGRLNEDRSRAERPIEIAIEAKFKELDWIDPGQVTGKMDGKDADVCVRAVVKEDRNNAIKKIIVSVYADNGIDPSITPEVQEDDIW